MRTDLCTKLGIEHPIVGFTPSEQVAAAISRAGGLGVLGCVRFNTQVRTVAERFGAFFAEADEGLRAFTSVGQVSAADYAGQDADTTATFSAMNRPTAASPLTGNRPAL